MQIKRMTRSLHIAGFPAAHKSNNNIEAEARSFSVLISLAVLQSLAPPLESEALRHEWVSYHSPQAGGGARVPCVCEHARRVKIKQSTDNQETPGG